MQTFLPYADFEKSAEVLDNKRLGKQRVETLQILRALLGYTQGWLNHPATVMWRGCTNALIEYGLAMCDEWASRGFDDSVYTKLYVLKTDDVVVFPKWFGNLDFHLSHQSNLLRKDPGHYAKYFGNIRNDLPYVWPGSN
jgi:hypothetical protein